MSENSFAYIRLGFLLGGAPQLQFENTKYELAIIYFETKNSPQINVAWIPAAQAAVD